MRLSLLAIAVAAACAFGCDRKPAPATQETKPGIEVNAPGVDVKVAPKEGVEVKAPGADVKVDTEPK